jgi:AcrR family transcriptional regulator
VSPKPPDPEVRTALIEAAARLLAEGGPQALTTRRLAEEVGTSTMAVYTYFRGMHELLRAVRDEGFSRFARFLDDVEPDHGDPIKELVELGGAYFLNATTNPHLYRFMFMEKPMDDDLEVGLYTFERLVQGVQRAIESGRFGDADPWELALQLWVAAHGVVSLYLAGMLTLDEAQEPFAKMAFNLFVAFGDDPEAASSSMKKGRRRFEILAPAG